MSKQPFFSLARWIGTGAAAGNDPSFSCFRRTFSIRGPVEKALLNITADSRYEVWVNGQWLGHGPVRSWLSPWPVDIYDLRGLLQPGENLIAVLGHHFGIGTFQYIPAAAGVIGELSLTDGLGERTLVTDRQWRCCVHEGYDTNTPRICCQQAYEEQYDARKEPSAGGDWRELATSDRRWRHAVEVAVAGEGEHTVFEPRGIPMLTREPVAPVRVCEVDAVTPPDYTWSLQLRECVNRHDRSANHIYMQLLVFTRITSPAAQVMELHLPHGIEASCKVNGKLRTFVADPRHHTDSGVATVPLRKGINTLLFRYGSYTHTPTLRLNLWSVKPLRFGGSDFPGKASSPWLVLGPFQGGATPESLENFSDLIMPDEIFPDATLERFDAIWERGDLSSEDLSACFTRGLTEREVLSVDVATACMGDRRVPDAVVRTEEPDALRHDTADWTTIHPLKGAAPRLLLDFGREVVGFQEFEIDAPAGTVLDVHNFEFIQRDGRYNLAEGMNNSFRYTCRDGVQRYRTLLRRGFQYSWLTFRQMSGPVRLRVVRTLMSTYPMAERGAFACGDSMLEQLWKVGAHSLRCCSEDTYTDCPSYEQTFWIGDGRNEALVDFVVNGDPRLSERCLRLAGRSLDRNFLVEGEVPSAWRSVLTAWALLWMRWAQEHYLYFGDKAFGRELLGYLDRNNRGLAFCLNQDDLIEIKAWNMFDWARMDTPSAGVVTHQNCLAVRALEQSSLLAVELGQKRKAEAWKALAVRLRKAINRHLWDEEKQAYIDCIHADGRRSEVFSQQTHTAAYLAGVSQAGRATRCLSIIENPPEGFVRAGSPFFMFFLLENLVQDGRYDEMIHTLREYWRPQVEAGASTTWECYWHDQKRMTRSHCHGWSAAPTYFLSTHVLGVAPVKPGFSEAVIAPKLGTIPWAWGRVPTPRGDVTVRWDRDTVCFRITAQWPKGMVMRLELPVKGKVRLLEGKARRIRAQGGLMALAPSGTSISLEVHL